MDQAFREAYRTWNSVARGFFNKTRDREKSQRYFQNAAGQELGAQYKCQIAYLLACSVGGIAQKQFRELLVAHSHDHPNQAPRPRVHTETGVYEEKTWYNWLHGKQPPMPNGEMLKFVVEHVLSVADDQLSNRQKLKEPGSLKRLLSSYVGTARKALSDSSFLLASEHGGRDWRRIEPEIIGVLPMGEGRGLAKKNIEDKYPLVCECLASCGSVQLIGPHYSGKNALLRKVVLDHSGDGFQIGNGSLLQICALSLHEVSPIEAIARVAAFYRRAVGVSSAGETVHELLGEIAHFAKQFPALVVISGVDAIDSDEIVRALRQDQLGEMISEILKGHPDTRLLVSASSEEHLYRRQPMIHRTDDRILEFATTIDMADSQIAPTSYEYYAVRACAEALCTPERGLDRSAISDAVADSWFEDIELESGAAVGLDRTHALATFICSHMLSDVERFALGLVALSHDGLKPSTLMAIFEALSGQLSESHRHFNPVETLDRLPDELARKPAPAESAGPECYQIERALRDPLLIHWRDTPDSVFRLANWGIARAAANEARRLRLHSGIDVSAGRDVQVLLCLLASIDPMNCLKPSSALPAEHQILPSLSRTDALLPDAPEILRFAFTNLFESDLARSAESGVQIFDAQLRLAAVHPFLDNRWPWLTYAASSHERESWIPAPDRSPWLALDLDAQLRLLAFASGAASRLGLRMVISACSELARNLVVDEFSARKEDPEPLIELTDRQFELFSRVRRYELDFAILLGGNPDEALKSDSRPSDGKTGLAGISERIDMLIRTIPKPGSHVGQREVRLLRARRAEVLHLRGRHVEAEIEYRKTAGLPHSNGRGMGAEGGSLSGRSRRMYTRLLVELARGRLYYAVDSEAVPYSDKLKLPIFSRVALSPLLLRKAQRLVEESLRSLSHGTMNDWIGAKIDHARLAAVQLRYSEAFELLDEAQHLVGAPGASRDVLLEYLSVRGRALADAAAFTMGAGAKDPKRPGPCEEELRRLAAYLKLDSTRQSLLPWQRASAISEALSLKALESLQTLKRLVILPETGTTRYAIYADYLEVWIDVVRSRERVESSDPLRIKATVRKQLMEAALKFQDVLGNMVSTGYMLSRLEAYLLVEAFRGADIPVKVPEQFPPIKRATRHQTSAK